MSSDRKLCRDQVFDVLSSSDPHADLARRHMVAVNTIRRVRQGQCYTNWYDEYIELHGMPVQNRRSRISPEQALNILESTESLSVLARQLGVSRPAVRAVRKGKAHRAVYDYWRRSQQSSPASPRTSIGKGLYRSRRFAEGQSAPAVATVGHLVDRARANHPWLTRAWGA